MKNIQTYLYKLVVGIHENIFNLTRLNYYITNTNTHDGCVKYITSNDILRF